MMPIADQSIIGSLYGYVTAFGFHHPWMLALLGLTILPLISRIGAAGLHPALDALPADRTSQWVERSIRLIAVLTMVTLVLAAAGLHRKEQPWQRISRGAEIVIVLDRSRSMDQGLVPNDNRTNWSSSAYERKGTVAQRLLSEFVTARPDDHFAFVLFSSRPIPISSFTSEHGVIQAAIAASQTGRGISDTELGQALESALNLFAERPFIGPRALMLVSDGGARLDVATRERLQRLIDQTRVGLYWIYLRSFRSPGLQPDRELSESEKETVPEHFLHRFFQSTGTFYRAYEAESPDAMQTAIEDIKRLEDRPIRYSEMRPVENLDRPLLVMGLVGCLAILAIAGWLARSEANPA